MGPVGKLFAGLALFPILGTGQPVRAQGSEASVRAELAIKSMPRDKKGATVPAVLWLTPLFVSKTERYLAWKPGATATMTQKDRMFHPHLLVVPVGTSVAFPNDDPFFHNVFSLFDGKRFDLGLYEAASTRRVVFSRPGTSYIFCNIHPEMSAVILALTTPYFAVADPSARFHLFGLPAGDYEAHLWVEGAPEAQMERFTRRVHISSGETDLGDISVEVDPGTHQHTNLFGQSYPATPEAPYAVP